MFTETRARAIEGYLRQVGIPGKAKTPFASSDAWELEIPADRGCPGYRLDTEEAFSNFVAGFHAGMKHALRPKQVIQLYHDPGHGWAKVERKQLVALGIIQRITSCSYEKGAYVYLEEDCDVQTLLAAFEEAHVNVEFRSKYANRQSRIRGYEPFRLREDEREAAVA